MLICELSGGLPNESITGHDADWLCDFVRHLCVGDFCCVPVLVGQGNGARSDRLHRANHCCGRGWYSGDLGGCAVEEGLVARR